MRRESLSLFLLIVCLLMCLQPLVAQWNAGYQDGFFPGLNLSPEQLDRVQDLRLQFQKDILPLRNELQTRFIEMRNLVYQGAGSEQVDAVRDGIYQLQEELYASFRDHRDEVKSLLTDEQKVQFDRWGGLGLGSGNWMGYCGGGGFGRGFGRGRGFAAGMGPGFGNGYGRGAGFRRGWGAGPVMGRGIGFGRGTGFRNW